MVWWSGEVVIHGCVYMPQHAAWDIHADPRHMEHLVMAILGRHLNNSSG